jgi:hypothetical protein
MIPYIKRVLERKGWIIPQKPSYSQSSDCEEINDDTRRRDTIMNSSGISASSL